MVAKIVSGGDGGGSPKFRRLQLSCCSGGVPFVASGAGEVVMRLGRLERLARCRYAARLFAYFASSLSDRVGVRRVRERGATLCPVDLKTGSPRATRAHTNEAGTLNLARVTCAEGHVEMAKHFLMLEILQCKRSLARMSLLVFSVSLGFLFRFILFAAATPGPGSTKLAAGRLV